MFRNCLTLWVCEQGKKIPVSCCADRVYVCSSMSFLDAVFGCYRQVSAQFRVAAPHTVGWPGGLGRRAAVVGDLGQTHAGYEEEPGTDLRVTDPHTRADDQRPARRH